MNNSFKGKRAKSVVLQLEDAGWTTPKLVKRLPPIPAAGGSAPISMGAGAALLGGIGDRRRNSRDQIVGKMAIR
jgi:hypothetical protein